MKIIVVNDMYECPFKYSESYQLSDVSSGMDTKCTILEDECWQGSCPLKKEGEVKVIWNVKEQEIK